jgi:CheY-like chemotaxis protein
VTHAHQLTFSVQKDNCLKFTDPEACIRISLKCIGDVIKLQFVDTGRGMSPDFVKNSLCVPFAQQNPLDAGTGLGLSLVESTVQALDGELRFETDESIGTEVSVLLPRGRLRLGPSKPGSIMADLHGPQEDPQDFSSLTMRLFNPTRWQQVDSLRHKRSHDIFTASLACTLRTWLNTDLQTGATIEETHGLIFVLHNDLQLLKSLTNEAYEHLKKVIFCPDTQVEAQVKASKPGAFATIVGAITPSKICKGVSLCHRNQYKRDTDNVMDNDLSIAYRGRYRGEDKEDIGCETRALAAVPQNSEGMSLTHCQLSAQTAKEPLSCTNPIPAKQTRDPRFLLVDDNAINLKVVAMYARKCSEQPSVLAGGGREAINALRTSPIDSVADASVMKLDIVLLDLSMPDVSGFDVASAVREMERLQVGRPRTYIAALTGLVSSKDREAAFAAGVDEYVTKPATLKDLRSVVENWRMAQWASRGG